MIALVLWVQQAVPPLSAAFWNHAYEIAAVAILLTVQSVWQRRSGSRAMETRFNSLTLAINTNRDTATAEFREVQRGMDALGSRIDQLSVKSDTFKSMVDGMLGRELSRLESDAQVTRRQRKL